MKIVLTDKIKLITSTIELDLRSWIAKEILNKKSLEILNKKIFISLKEKFYDHFHRKNKVEPDNDDYTDDILINYLDLGQCIHILNEHKQELSPPSLTIFKKIQEKLESIKPIRDLATHNLTIDTNDEKILVDFTEIITKYAIHFENTLQKLNNLKNNNEDFFDNEFQLNEISGNNIVKNNLKKSEVLETGYIQREKYNKKFNGLLKNNSLISIIGDAGSGKTTFVRKKVEELLYEKNSYQFIWWNTFKTETFSNNEVTILNNAIKTSFDFFNSIYKEEKDPSSLLLDYLKNNKVILILDNLETILDEKIIVFLDKFLEEDHQSKIIITSRLSVGLGANMKIENFDNDEGVYFFRKFVDYLELEDLKKLNDIKIKSFINLRNNNPLAIKLSLYLVSKGIRVEKAFEENKDYLDFCYLNTYETFSQEAKFILKKLYNLGRDLSFTELSILTTIETKVLENALQDLKIKNFIYGEIGNDGLTHFKIRKEITTFIDKSNYFEDQEEKKSDQIKFKKISTLKYTSEITNLNKIENLKASYDTFLKRNETDLLAANELKEILKIIHYYDNSKKFNKYKDDNNLFKDYVNSVTAKISNLKKVHKDYCEVYRVEAIFYGSLGKIDSMIQSFEKAITLQPDYPNLFIYLIERLRTNNEIEKSLEQANRCMDKFKIHNASEEEMLSKPYILEIYYQLMKSKMFKYDLDSGIELIVNKIKSVIFGLNVSKIDPTLARKLASDITDFYNRRISTNINNNYESILEDFRKMFQIMKTMKEKNLIDKYTITKNFKRPISTISKVRRKFSNQPEILKEIDFYINFSNEEISRFEDSPINIKLSNTADNILLNFHNPNSDKFDTREYNILEFGKTYEGQYVEAINNIGGYIKLDENHFVNREDGRFLDRIFAHKTEGILALQINTKVKFILKEFTNMEGVKSPVASSVEVIK
jgi:hypothetical protein